MTWPLVAGIGVLGGIGFTVSLLIADLSYADAALLADAKAGVLAGSLLAGLAGWLVLQRFAGRASRLEG